MTTYHRVHQGAHPFNGMPDYIADQIDPDPKPPRKPGWFRWLIACLIAIGVILTIGVIASAGTATGAFAPHNGPGMSVGVAAGEAASAPPWVAPTQKPVSGPTLGEGTWEVPSEVKPGTYTTTADDHCYWARLSSFDGGLDAIITNGNLDPGARGRITVKKADKGLELTGSCEWKRTG